MWPFFKKKKGVEYPVWITNYRDSALLIDPDGRFYQNTNGGSICTTCGKHMHNGWNVVCYTCGDTSCYEHSVAVEGGWYCIKHDPSLELEFRQTIPGWRGELADCFKSR